MTPPEEPSGLGQYAGSLAYWRDLLLVLSLVIFGLVQGAGFLVPLTFALLVFVLLTAVIDRVGRVEVAGHRMPGVLAHLIGILIILSGLLVIGLILANQTDDVADALPRYSARFDGLTAAIVSVIGEENARSVVEAMQNADVSAWVVNALGSAGGFLGALFLVALYVPFMMVERRPMRRKFAIAARDEHTGSDIRDMVHSISAGLRRYIGVKTFVSLLTGVFSYAVMKPLGLDFAETWAVLAFALNFIPSIGSILGVVFPALVAIVQFDTITPFLIIVLGCGTVQFSIGNILEPAITGRSLNLSSFLVILSLTFWSTIWGVAGAFLSVPITVCMLIVFAHIPSTRWLAVLMSGDGDLVADL